MFNIPPYTGLTDAATILNPSFSVELWARITDDGSDENTLVGKWSSSGDNRFTCTADLS